MSEVKGRMPKFWSVSKNSRFMVGCTGQTVYVYVYENDIEVAKFKDIKYGYTSMFCPNKNIFVVKSAMGLLAVYSLDELKLIRKFRFSKVDGAQDDSFCFSPDGKFFYNIERHIDSCKSRLAVYDTNDFKVIKYLFEEDYNTVLDHIEFDSKKNRFVLLGFNRGKRERNNEYFVSELENDQLKNIVIITEKQFDYILGFKMLEAVGFTAKAKEWSWLKHQGYNLDAIEQISLNISDYL